MSDVSRAEALDLRQRDGDRGGHPGTERKCVRLDSAGANSVGSKQIINGQVKLKDMAPSARASLLKARGYARIRVIGIIGGGPYWNMALVGPHREFISARTPAGGVTCLKPDANVLSLSDVEARVMQDASGNDTRLYFDGSFGCNSDEVRVVQKSNFDGSSTNQDFNIIVP